MTIQDLATEALGFFERFTRGEGDGSDDNPPLYKTEDQPEWVTDLCREAHDDGGGSMSMLPDDWRYSFIVEVLGTLEDHDDPDEARDSLEADVYTSEITAWLHSRNSRYGYADEAVEQGLIGDDSDTLARLMMGQLTEKWEVFESVRAFLEKRVEDLDDEEDDDDE